ATTTSYTYDTADRLVNSGYTYDAFGRTTALPGSTIGYYANDLVQQQTAGTQRQTWTLDSALRPRGFTTESNNAGSWTQTSSKLNHYDSDSDDPRWVVEDTSSGAVTRNVDGLDGNLVATTTDSGDTVLQLANLHGDTALMLPADTSVAPTVLDYDEYGNPRADQPATRYGWLGAEQRSSETPTGLTLMGVRLYNSATGRFLSVDPVPGGSANAYDYVAQDPVNATDLDGRCFWDGCVAEGYGAYLLGAAAVGGAYWLYKHPVHVSWHVSWHWHWHWHFFKAKKNKSNGGKRYKSRTEAESRAREDARRGGRCRFRGPCRKGNHVHVDYYNKWGEISHTEHYGW
ncbi:RHS repeat-associated core domain-containing protein, partial [Streptomyces sp. NPDC127063]|uniref:RHS repeat-associated core domain-containing protein n=1 Tax=Streptomyces sp. NPDC127063 TaxID=3347123 RepID=UPI003668876F